MELIIDRLSKQYKNKIAVDRISLTLHQGVYGLLGANGAGKTTLMRMLCGILRPTSGTVMFENMDVSTEDYRKELGYLPQDFGYYPNFTGRDFLMYMAVLKGMTKSRAQKRCAKLLDEVGLKEMGDKKIKTYSGGMKQRLGIAQALLSLSLIHIWRIMPPATRKYLPISRMRGGCACPTVRAAVPAALWERDAGIWKRICAFSWMKAPITSSVPE